ncbi:hypothetical protein JX265_000244 [Neoarthrinium moseri]|uniref:Uncharacterized protein n=1 Tax=Neoarthrinium moseri TaxID=1658444 RepID=A0A9Q0AUQ6_9PEZI|nr:hypothetical protein JX266_001963 [Neoarthrinium moseri]KAI1881418.1 hypothetical protein JX265_000244 [Neoarthrinium moseri]
MGNNISKVSREDDGPDQGKEQYASAKDDSFAPASGRTPTQRSLPPPPVDPPRPPPCPEDVEDSEEFTVPSGNFDDELYC